MLEKPEDIEKATLEEVLQWCKTNLPYMNENDENIWERIIEVCSKYGFRPPMTQEDIWEECDEQCRREW